MGEEFQRLIRRLKYLEGFLRLNYIPLEEETLFTLDLRIERITNLLKKKFIKGELK